MSTHPDSAQNDDEVAAIWSILESRRPLPLRFSLYQSRRPNQALCPCIQVDLPSISDRDQVFTVTRILDPEHKQPYISLSPLLSACGLSIVQGLLRFRIQPTEFDLSLLGLEPFDEIWVSFSTARKIAQELGILPRLSALLDPRTRLAWSLDEGQLGVSHNWIVGKDFLDPSKYSTQNLLSTPFSTLQLLKSGEQVRTLVSDDQRLEAKRSAQEHNTSSSKLQEKLVRWSSALYSAWIEVNHASELLSKVKIPPLKSVEGAVQDGKAADADDEEANYALRRTVAVVQDIDLAQLPPTLADFSEWLQAMLFDTPASDHDADNLFQPMSLEELIHLREIDEPKSPSSPSKWRLFTSAEETIEKVETLHLTIRAKMGALHRMQMISEGAGQLRCIELVNHSRSEPHHQLQEVMPASAQSMVTSSTNPSQKNHSKQPYDHLLESIQEAIKQGLSKAPPLNHAGDRDSAIAQKVEEDIHSLTNQVQSLSDQVSALLQQQQQRPPDKSYQSSHRAMDSISNGWNNQQTESSVSLQQKTFAMATSPSLLLSLAVLAASFVLVRYTASPT